MPAQRQAGIRAVAFDLDGTLIDSRLDFAAIRRELDFPPGRGLLEHIATLQDPAAVARAHAVIERHEMAGAEAAQWMPGAERLLDRLVAADMPMAILPRNMRAAADLACRSLGIPVELVLTREDCRPKPDPEGLLEICRRLSVAPARLVYVGDFVYDLQTARAAGAVSCLYRYGDNGRYAVDADWVVDHLDELAGLLGVDLSGGHRGRAS